MWLICLLSRGAVSATVSTPTSNIAFPQILLCFQTAFTHLLTYFLSLFIYFLHLQCAKTLNMSMCFFMNCQALHDQNKNIMAQDSCFLRN